MKPTSHDAVYAPLRDSSNENHEDEEIDITELKSEASRYTYAHPTSRTPFLAAVVSTILLAILAVVLAVRLIHLERTLHNLPEDQCGFSTDLKDAVPYINYEERVFTGLIRMNKSSGSVYHYVPDGEPRYFGDPAIYPEIDNNWKDLLGSK